MSQPPPPPLAPPPQPLGPQPAATKPDGTSRMIWIVGIILIVGLVLVGPRLFGGARGAPAAARTTVHFDGSRIMQTGNQHLEGDYRVDWKATNNDGRGCFHGVFLRTSDNRIAEDLVNADVTGQQAGTTNVYGLDAGDYHLDASSGCDSWSFDFVPQ